MNGQQLLWRELAALLRGWEHAAVRRAWLATFAVSMLQILQAARKTRIVLHLRLAI
jgi:hypothetical protein